MSDTPAASGTGPHDADRVVIVKHRFNIVSAYMGRTFSNVANRREAPSASPGSSSRALYDRLFGDLWPRKAAISLAATYSLIADRSPDLVTGHDQAGQILFASSASHRVLGIAPTRLMVDGFKALLDDHDWARFRTALERSFGSQAAFDEEFRIELPDGAGKIRDLWIEVRGRAPSQADPTLLLMTRDITARKADIVKLSQSRDEAERVSRSKSAFLAEMSHELRTPLNSIIGFSEFLQNELRVTSADPKQADFCRMIHESGEHLLSLVGDLLDIAKIEAGHFNIEPEPCALDEVIRSVVEALRPLAEGKGLTIATSLDADLVDIHADRRAIRQILINLVANACKFTQQGGVTVFAHQHGDDVAIGVIDTGIGIAPEHLSRIGEPFYRQARGHEGTGLGLSIVRGLVELHGGRLEIESLVGEGSCFTVVLSANGNAASRPVTDATMPPCNDLKIPPSSSRPAPRLADLASSEARTTERPRSSLDDRRVAGARSGLRVR
jgi:cell cycle sensor histidine kinase DivJ